MVTANALDSSTWRHRPVLVTGATGFLGSHLTQVLVDAGAEVVVLCRDELPWSPDEPWWGRVTRVRGSIEDEALLERVLGEYMVRTVFHLAAQTQVRVANRNARSTFEANVLGTWALLEAVRRSPSVEGVITASSDKAYGAQEVLPYREDMPLLAVHPYDVSKACADLIARSYHATWDVPVVVTRCGNFFGPGDRNWDRLIPGTSRLVLGGNPPVLRSDGTPERDYLFVRDGAGAYVRAAEALADDRSLAGECFNFSTGEPLSAARVVELVQHAAGTTFETVVLSDAPSEIPAQHLDATKARTVLGWTPGWSVEEAMDETVGWYRALLS